MVVFHFMQNIKLKTFHIPVRAISVPHFKILVSGASSGPSQNFLPPPCSHYTKTKTKTKLRGLSPRENYTDRAAAAGRRS